MKRSDGFSVDRRRVVGGLAALLLGGAASQSLAIVRAQAGPPLGPPAPYDFADLRERARRLAEAPYVPPQPVHPELLETIDFDAYQAISFNPAMTLWDGADQIPPVRLFHLGRYVKLPVRIHLVNGGAAREVRYTADAFRYADPALAARLPHDLGFAGFRLMDPAGETDWLAFLGASYFRSAGPERQYGVSARGLAIDTGLSTPEEFPRFSEFWLHQPENGAEPVVVDALLESESCAGAYRFAISRASQIVMEVSTHLYTRRAIKRLGVAPLTSMFWYSETNRRQATDWRPEVHDSDGLALWTGRGERIWRPLNNPWVVRTSAFVDESPKGFGLLQRDRSFHNYEDDGAFYNRRPGIWVQPLEPWGAGEIQLVEIPTDDEIHDNIVVYWKPARPVPAGDELAFAYRLCWVADDPYRPVGVGSVVATRVGRGGIPGKPRPDGVRKFVIDFEGGALDELEQRFDVEPVVDASRGDVAGRYAIKVVGTPRWRAFFDLAVEGDEPVDLRCYLRLDGRVLTETWLFQHLPAES